MEHPVAGRALPFAVFIAFIALGDAAGGLLPALGFDARWWPVARAGVVALMLWGFWKSYVELHDFPIRRRDLLGAVGAGAAVFFLWIHLDFGWATLGGAGTGFVPTLPGGEGIDWTLALPRLAGFALVVPVMEELFWRSFLMRWIDSSDFLALDPRRASAKAVIVSSLLFASEHHLWLAGLIAGVVYGVIYIRTRNLWLPVVGHAVTNGLLGIWILATGHWQFW